MKVAFLPEAQAELDQTLRLIATFPEFHPLVDKKLRRCLVNRFSYGVFYGVADDSIIVVAIAHLRRKPSYWAHRKRKK